MLAGPFARADVRDRRRGSFLGEYRGQPAVQNAHRAPQNPFRLQTGRRQWSCELRVAPSTKTSRPLALVFAVATEQCAIAASHETQPRPDQANGPAAEMVCFPAAIGNTMLAE